MKFLLASLFLVTASAADCVVGDFTLEAQGKCTTYATLLASFAAFFADKVNVAHTGCTNSAEAELLRLLGAANVQAAETLLNASCSAAIQNYESLSFKDIAGYGEEFDDLYFRGFTDWNEEVATLYPVDPKGDATDPESNFLKREAVQVLNVYNSDGRYGLVDWPEFLDYLDPSKCNMNTVYCCWPKDRQANDNNGNCARPYDKACVDSNPGDNTDLCYVEPNMGTGFLTFPGDDNNNQPYKAEGPSHCHGFGWVDGDMTDSSVVYRGNNLFYISMYDHMYQRGYVRNIAGAPMCGCAEVMPVVTRADCTQMAVSEKFTWTYDFDKKTFAPALTDITITYNACTGIDQNGKASNNNLWAYANRLFIEGRLSRAKLQALTRKLVGDNNCVDAERRMLASRGLSRGYKNKDAEWTLLGGRESLGNYTFIGKEGFNYLINGNNTADPSILRRLCASCVETHQYLYYKRLTPIPDQLSLINHIMFDRTNVTRNTYGVDFLIFSSFEDAKDSSNTRAWKCPAYNYTKGFPGDCGPGGTIITGQEVIFGSTWSKTDAAWHVETNSTRTLTPIPTTLIGNISLDGSMLGSSYISNKKMYLTASGVDIWDIADSFMFYDAPKTGVNVTMITHISGFDHRHEWSKAGLMIRESNVPGARHFSVLLTGTRGVSVFLRSNANGFSSIKGQNSVALERNIWLKLTKVGNVYTGYKSVDGVTWLMIDKPQTLLLGDTNLRTGLAVTSRERYRLSEAVFSDYTIE